MSKTSQQKIIKSAEDLLWKRGFEATSVNQLVDKAGLSKGAFFHYYPSKQAIAEDVIEAYFQDHVVEPLKSKLMEEASIKNALFGWISLVYQELKDRDFKGGCLMGNMALELSDQDEAARERIRQKFLDLENIFVLALRPLAREGKLAMEPRQFARLLISSVQGMTMMAKVHKDHIRASREFQAIGEMIDCVIKH